MKLLFDLFPIILFFVAYKVWDIFVATGVSIAAAFVQTLIFYLQHKRFEKTHLITLGLLTVFGGLTIVLRDPEFVMWKVTVINILFAIAFIGSFFIGKKTLIERMVGSQIDMPKPIWHKLNFIWSGLFFIIAAINTYFVLNAIKARDMLFANTDLDPKTALNKLNCADMPVQNLCLEAQNTEEIWVNFKLFGTMGLTLLFVFITAFYISKYVKDVPNQ